MQTKSIRKLDSLASRFWALAGRRSISECWHWQGALYTNGYGSFSPRQGEGGDRIAHRMSWLIHAGAIPSDLLIRHICAQTDCVNPTHLRLGTQSQNMLDWRKLGRKSFQPQPRSQPWPARVWRSCRQCGEPISAGRNRAFCSLDCREASDAIRLRKENKERARPEGDRFWSRVEKSAGCWLWKGSATPEEYGHFKTDTVQTGAHRYSWILHRGPIDAGLLVLHNCPGGDQPACVNPSHLWLGTHLDNVRDAIAKGRWSLGDRHWLRRHPELRQRGNDHWTHRLPERVARGETHPGMRRLRVEVRGEGNGNSRWTAQQVREIRRRTAAGERQASIARELGMSRSTMSAIVNRRLWPYLE